MEREEVKDMITAETGGALARIEASVFLIANDVKHIEAHMKEANGRTGKNEGHIDELWEKVAALEKELPHSVVNCPQDDTLKEIKQFIDQKKGHAEGEATAEDKAHTKRQEERADAMKRITTASVTIAAIALVINLVLSISSRWEQSKIKQGQSELKEEVDMINTPVRTRGGVIKWYPSGVLIDSLNAHKDTLKVDW